jgi:hypothetical protein
MRLLRRGPDLDSEPLGVPGSEDGRDSVHALREVPEGGAMNPDWVQDYWWNDWFEMACLTGEIDDPLEHYQAWDRLFRFALARKAVRQ